MNQAMWISKTGLQAQDEKLQEIANNLANVNTVGFKRDRLVFEDLAYQIEQQPGGQQTTNVISPSGIQLGTGTRLVSSQKVFTQGNTQNTGQQLDVAIMGNGFLEVLTDSGDTAYTRAGQLQINDEGNLVNAQGLPIQPQIAIPQDAVSITISEDGTVTATRAGSTTPMQIGKLQLANFVNMDGLAALGDNLYQESMASGPPIEGDPGLNGLGKIKQGALEGSNVQVVEEMVDMIAAQRTYEMNTKVLTAADNMLQQIAQVAR